MERSSNRVVEVTSCCSNNYCPNDILAIESIIWSPHFVLYIPHLRPFYRLHYFDTPTGYRFVLTSDPRLSDLREHLSKIYSDIFVTFEAGASKQAIIRSKRKRILIQHEQYQIIQIDHLCVSITYLVRIPADLFPSIPQFEIICLFWAGGQVRVAESHVSRGGGHCFPAVCHAFAQPHQPDTSTPAPPTPTSKGSMCRNSK